MKNQKITLIVLAVVSALLLLEFIRGNTGLNRQKERLEDEKQDVIQQAKDTTTKRVSVADSIAALYASVGFKQEQMKYSRVKAAFQEKGKQLRDLYAAKQIDPSSMQLYIRAFKKEKLVEIWGKDKQKTKYILLKTYAFCKSSGTLGPKRKEGDKQIPEGFYHISVFNPRSKFYLSLGLNYPNRSDRILGDTTALGSDIFIHGGCATVGCIPITDENIKELYALTVDAKAATGKTIPVTIFPARLTEENYNALKTQYAGNPQLISFWKGLKGGYQAFEKCRKLPNVVFAQNGNYICSPDCD